MSVQSADYFYGGQQNELDRLLGQAEDLKPESAWLLDQIGICPGWRTADIGCGPIGVLDMLASRVGPSGSVVGVEREHRFAEMARAETQKRGLSNVSIVEGDMLSAELQRGSFDLVHERLVLINVPESNKRSIVSAMYELARPGGVLAVESWDRASFLCYPEIPSWTIMNGALRDAVKSGDVIPSNGRALPSLLKQAGVIDIKTKVHVRAVEVGDVRRTHRLGLLDVSKAKILAMGLLNEADFDAHRKALAQHLSDPDTLLIDPLFIQSWGRRPK